MKWLFGLALIGVASATPVWAQQACIPGGNFQVTPITASTTGTTAAVAATLAAVAGKFTYICGFTMTSGGTTAAITANGTVAGLATGTLNFAYTAPAAGQGLLGIAFPLCLQASAPNTTIVVTQPAGGAGTVAAVAAWGCQQ